MNKPINRYPCGDMGTEAGGGIHEDNPTPGYWQNSIDGDRSIDAVGPTRVTGRLGHGYALHNVQDSPDEFPEGGGGIRGGDGFPALYNRGLEVIGVGDPEVDYFIPSGFLVRAYCSLDRMTELGDVNYYDGTFYKAANFMYFLSHSVGVRHTGELAFYAFGLWTLTGVFIDINEFHLYEIFVELRDADDVRTTRSSLRVDEEVIAEVCISNITYDSISSVVVGFNSYSSGMTVDDIAIDAITSREGHWIGPGECAIVRPVASVDRPIQSWASGTDFSPENSDPSFATDPAHPQCTPGTFTDWYEALAFEVPYRPLNWGAEAGDVGGGGSIFGMGYMMSNPGADPAGWTSSAFPTCASSRRNASGEEMIMTLADPGFTPNFSRAFFYAGRSERIYNRDDTIASEKLIGYIETEAGYAAVYNFGEHDQGHVTWAMTTQYLDDAAADLNLVIRREINLPHVGVNVFAAGSQVAIDENPGPALTFCTPVVDTTGPIICFV